MQSGHSGNNCTNRTIGYLCYKSKLSDMKIAILKKKHMRLMIFIQSYLRSTDKTSELKSTESDTLQAHSSNWIAQTLKFPSNF